MLSSTFLQQQGKKASISELKETNHELPLPRDGEEATAPPPLATDAKQEVEKANKLLNRYIDQRLKVGLNLTLTDFGRVLIANGTPKALIEDVMAHVEFRLNTECKHKILIKRSFKNDRGVTDVMYFDARYRHLLKPEA